MADTSDLHRAGRSDLLRIIEEQKEEIRRLVAPELAKRDAQITELQTTMSKMVNDSLPRRVRAFQKKFGHPVAWAPKVPDKAQVQFRLKLIAEEFFELLAACEIWPQIEGVDPNDEIRAHELVTNAIENDFSGTVDLPELIDALGDMEWVIEGCRAVFGVDGGPVMDEINRANMSKDPVYVHAKDAFHTETADPAAKPTKPEGWKPPDIETVLREQGWRE